jgi:hypothetical protein
VLAGAPEGTAGTFPRSPLLIAVFRIDHRLRPLAAIRRKSMLSKTLPTSDYETSSSS